MLIVGVCGVTNGGKTTLAEALHKALPKSHLLCQDTYFFPKDSGHHLLIPELNHFNWEIMSSLDMDRMWKDVELFLRNNSCLDKYVTGNSSRPREDTNVEKEGVSSELLADHNDTKMNVLIIEGFLVLNYKAIADICDLKYHLTLTKEECLKRRNTRVYDPADVPGYFELCVWPEYMKHKAVMLQNVKDVKVIDGTRDFNSIFEEALNDINNKIKNG